MGKSKLKSALLRQQGVDVVAEKKKKISQKKSKKGVKKTTLDSDDESEDSDNAPELVETAQSDDNEAESAAVEIPVKVSKKAAAAAAAEESEEEDDEEDWEEEEDDVALSDIESENDFAVDDIIPYQKLTIDNHAALTSLLKRIQIPTKNMKFSEHQTMTTAEPTEIKDIHDDMTRELAFYKQALDSATRGRELLKKERVPFERPADYFAEMMKDDEHMDKVKAKLLEAAERKKRSMDARKLRDLKKFGKQVQVAKLQEREKAKKETLEKIQVLKRKRATEDTGAEGEESMFDVALDDEIMAKAKAPRDKKRARGDRESTDQSKAKRSKKDSKYGHGGKKRFSKSGDAASSGDLGDFSQKKNNTTFGSKNGGNKAGGGAKKGKGAPRPGKSKRTGNRR